MCSQHLRRTTIYVSEGELIGEATNQAVETEICLCYFESPRRGSQRGVVAQLSTEKKGEKDVSLKVLFPIYFFYFLIHFVLVWVHVLIHHVFKE